jgi:hypothetical protein
MNYFPSPPNSPYLQSFLIPNQQQQQQNDHVVCGACNKSLGADWFCSDCHRKCNSCNRFLGQNEYCTRCWFFDPVNQQFSRKINKYYYYQPPVSHFTGLPSPSNSTGSTISSNSSHGPKLLTRPFTWKN